MSTRAMYSFIDDHETFHVYKHHDGYPTGAAEWIEGAKTTAWALPRFEADEFSASFVAANKTGDGGVRLMHSGEWDKVAPGDLEYRYEVCMVDKVLTVRAYAVSCSYPENVWTCTKIWEGPQSKFEAWANSPAAAGV